MYTSPQNERIHHAQVGANSGTQEVQNIYWRCVFMLFESSSRLNDGVRHILFINRKPPDLIDGIDVNKLIKQYNIEIVEFPSITISPPDYYKSWNTQFIVLDVLEWLRENVRKDDCIFILDSDILFNKPINNELIHSIKINKALLYSIDYDNEYIINGVTRKELKQISIDIDPKFTAKEFVYSGGEIICCLGSEIGKISDKGRINYEVSLQRYKDGKKKFNEEAHLLSYVYHLLGYRTHTANRFIKRIWTNRIEYSNIDGTEPELIFWHLPGEKKRGFVKVFRSFREINGIYKLTTKSFSQAFNIEETYLSKATDLIKKIARPVYKNLKSIKYWFTRRPNTCW